MDLAPQIIEMLATGEGLQASDIAKQLGVDRKQINAILYGPLKGQVRQDKSYKWYLANNVGTGAEKAAETTPTTILSQICRYYLECLSFDTDQKVSAFADGQFDLDYAEIDRLPFDEDRSKSLFSSPEASSLRGKLNKARFKKTLYLGYPVYVRCFTSRAGSYFRRVEPIMLFPMDTDSSQTGSSPLFQLQYPQFNFEAMEHLSGSKGIQLLQEIVELGEQLGLNSSPEEMPELDELFLRLQGLCEGWDWKENIDLENLGGDSELKAAAPGIYNRAIIILGERSSYTVGLETELSELQKKDESDLRHSVLGNWLKTTSVPPTPASTDTEASLLEVLPLNTEQRQAIRSAMKQKLTVITGPPGTGKSQVVTGLMVNAAWQGKRVLFASKNHKAVDVVEHRVNGLGPRPILLRLGRKEYRQRLADYLSRVLGMSPTAEDQEDYERLNEIYTEQLNQRKTLESAADEVVQLRNTVDHLEQRVADHRSIFGDEYFHQLKNVDVQSDLEAIQRFRVNVSRADIAQQGIFAKLFWGMIKKARFKEASAELEKVRALIETLNLSVVSDQVCADNIHDWSKLCDELGRRYDAAVEVQNYFSALGTLSSSCKLEEIDAELMDLDEQMARVCMQLWQKWLKLMPTRLNSQERDLLGEYAAIVQLLAEAEQAGQQAARHVFAKYQTMLPRVMNVFSCWAVTSLSARGGRIPFEPGYFDIVVIDEASQCDIASALPLLYRAKQAVIIGDPNQLKHISPIPRAKDTQLLDRYELLHTHAKYAYSVNSLYDLAATMVTPGALINLRDHHRSHADIIEFSNQHFYEGSLRVATRYDALNLLSKEDPSVRWHHVAGEAIRPKSGSAQNVQEAEKVVAIISDLLLSRGYTGSIGVVSPFRAQVNYIDRLLNASSGLSNRLVAADVLVDTVHKFQGDERDVMIFSPVVAKGMSQSSLKFLQGNGNLFNVAITRARSALIVVGDMNAAHNSQIDYLASFASYAQSLNTQRDQNREAAQSIELGADYPTVSNPEQVSDWERWFYQKLYAAGLRPIPQYSEEKYRLDFALFDEDRKLDIEVDGERYHREWTGELCQRDRIRNQRLIELDWDVMRFWVYEIRDDTDTCIQRVQNWINSTS